MALASPAPFSVRGHFLLSLSLFLVSGKTLFLCLFLPNGIGDEYGYRNSKADENQTQYWEEYMFLLDASFQDSFRRIGWVNIYRTGVMLLEFLNCFVRILTLGITRISDHQS